MKVACVCQKCGVRFEVEGWAVKQGRGKYCSQQCAYADRTGKARPVLLKRISKACVVCGGEFETGGRAGRLDKAFCSRECQRRGRYRTGRACSELLPLDASYLAGFWDGEGSFILHGTGSTSGAIAFRVVAVASKPQVIEWIAQVTGIGRVQTWDAKNPKWAPRWTWTVNGDGAESFTRQLLPYLKLKREQAELGVAFQERLRDPALKADRSWQAEWRQRMRDLNRRGTDPRQNAEA